MSLTTSIVTSRLASPGYAKKKLVFAMMPCPWSWKNNIKGRPQGQEGHTEVKRSFIPAEIIFLV